MHIAWRAPLLLVGGHQTRALAQVLDLCALMPVWLRDPLLPTGQAAANV